MGHNESKERELFIDIAKLMLNKRGLAITSKQLRQFFHFLQECSPWFPEEGTLNLKTWIKVGKEMMTYYEHHGPERVPADALSLWSLFKDALDPTHEAVCLADRVTTLKQTPLTGATSNTANYKSTASSSSDTEEDLDDKFSPQDQQHLKEAVNKYHNSEGLQNLSASIPLVPLAPPFRQKPRRPSKNRCGPGPQVPHRPIFIGAIPLARESGDISLSGPVTSFEDSDSPPTRQPLSFKLLKELKTAVKDFGATSPYTLQLVDSVAAKWMTPFDWQQTAKSCLAPGQYLLWKAEYEEQAERVIQNTIFKRGQPQLTVAMLTGNGDYYMQQAQLSLSKPALLEVSKCAVTAWRNLPVSDSKQTFLSNVKQKATEPYEEFMARLQDTISKVITNTEAADLLTKQLAFENANPTCQALLRPIRKTGTLTDFIRICMDFTPAHIQGIAIAAALQGKSYSQFLKAYTNIHDRFFDTATKGYCFTCTQPGHFSRDCPLSKDPKLNNKPKTICPKCQKGFHWARECRSKYDKQGQLLSKSSTTESKNRLQGLPWV